MPSRSHEWSGMAAHGQVSNVSHTLSIQTCPSWSGTPQARGARECLSGSWCLSVIPHGSIPHGNGRQMETRKTGKLIHQRSCPSIPTAGSAQAPGDTEHWSLTLRPGTSASCPSYRHASSLVPTGTVKQPWPRHLGWSGHVSLAT